MLPSGSPSWDFVRSARFPLSTAHRKLGSLVFASHLDDAYSTQDQQFLSVVANQIAVALDDARAQARLRLLLDITNRIVTKLELRDLLREIVTSVRHFMQCDTVGVALPDPEDGELRRYAVDHADYEMSVGPASERTKTVFRTGKPLIAHERRGCRRSTGRCWRTCRSAFTL